MSDRWGTGVLDDMDPADPVVTDSPSLRYPTLTAWVTEYLAPTIRRPEKNGRVWCPQWWRHAEAISRLEALWRSWEHLRLDGATGMSTWWRDHADHHLAALIDTDGPFSRCRCGHAGENDPLAVEPPPADWFSTPTS